MYCHLNSRSLRIGMQSSRGKIRNCWQRYSTKIGRFSYDSQQRLIYFCFTAWWKGNSNWFIDEALKWFGKNDKLHLSKDCCLELVETLVTILISMLFHLCQEQDSLPMLRKSLKDISIEKDAAIVARVSN